MTRWPIAAAITILAASYTALAGDPPAAVDTAPSVTVPEGSPTDAEAVQHLIRTVDRQFETIDALTDERTRLRLRIRRLLVKVERRDNQIVRLEKLVPPPSDLDRWVDGYLEAGGPPHLIETFVERIIPCESSGRVDVVSPSRDYGLAQINRRVHRPEVERLFPDVPFETSMLEAYPNGFFAGVLAGRSGTQPWYMSARCSGV